MVKRFLITAALKGSGVPINRLYSRKGCVYQGYEYKN